MTSVTEGRFQCPCCDYYVLDARRRHNTCPVCWWEDDGTDLDDVDTVSPANHVNLRTARACFARHGASDQAAVSLVVPRAALAGLRREVRTRP